VESTDLLRESALSLARLVRERKVSAEELARLYLARIERLDPQVNAFVQVLRGAALREARRRDDELRRKGPGAVGPFHGVPTGIKDLNLVRGSFTRFGSRAFKWFWSPVDDKTTAQLRRAGFVVLGKLSTSEIGAMPVTEPDIHPATRNPWSLEHSSGGSSGGSGAAVAAGLVPIAQGSDGAGSIRIPSAFCHLYGIKASRGRVVDSYGRPDRHTLVTVGPIARTVDDAAAMLDVMAGLSIGEPHWAPRPPAPFAELARRTPGALRIRFVTRSPVAATTHPEVAEAVHRTARALEALGHHVEEGAVPDGTLEEFLPIWQRMLATIPVPSWSRVQPITRWLADAGKTLRDEDVARLQAELERRVHEWFGDADLWLTPTVALPSPRVGAFMQGPPAEGFRGAAELGAFTALFNVSGQPAANVPAGLTAEGLPVGVQLAGRPNDEATVLAVSRQLEEAMPWRHRLSPMFVQ
jgi:amidase